MGDSHSETRDSSKKSIFQSLNSELINIRLFRRRTRKGHITKRKIGYRESCNRMNFYGRKRALDSNDLHLDLPEVESMYMLGLKYERTEFLEVNVLK